MPKHLFIFVLLLSLSSCDPVDDKLKFQNNSSDTLNVNISFDYPDTTLKCSPLIDSCNSYSYWILPGNTVSMRTYNNTWEHWITMRNQMQTLSIFILDKSELNKLDCDNYNGNDLQILKRKDYTLRELEKENWIVAYP